MHRGVNKWTTKTEDGLLALLGTEIPLFVLQWGIYAKSLSRCVTYNNLFMKCRKLMSTARCIHYIRFKPRKRELHRYLQDIWTPKETFRCYSCPAEFSESKIVRTHTVIILIIWTWHWTVCPWPLDLTSRLNLVSNYTNRTGNLS